VISASLSFFGSRDVRSTKRPASLRPFSGVALVGSPKPVVSPTCFHGRAKLTNGDFKVPNALLPGGAGRVRDEPDHGGRPDRLGTRDGPFVLAAARAFKTAAVQPSSPWQW